LGQFTVGVQQPVRVSIGAQDIRQVQEMLVGFDDDLAGEPTRLSNRIHGLLTGIHPALEGAIGPKVMSWRSSPAAADLPASPGQAAASSPRSRRSTCPGWAIAWSRRA
jgi:hypothetical protein